MRQIIEAIQDWLDRAEDYLRGVLDGFRLRDEAPAGAAYYDMSAEAEYTEEARRALEEWKAAESYFNSIEDQELVEYALYEVEAARRKYEYLMRKLRNGDAAWEHRSSRAPRPSPREM
jgi:hypothetical protein